MKVDCHFKTDDQPLVCAYPASTGILFRLCSGNVCDPENGNWFTPPYPTIIMKFKLSLWLTVAWLAGIALLDLFCSHWFLLALPITPGFYFSWRLGSWWGGYIGWQVYGVDSPTYKNWLPESEVFDGSQAISFTARLTTHVD